MKKLTDAYDALIAKYNSMNTSDGPLIMTEPMNNAMTNAIEALRVLATDMTSEETTSGGKYRRTRRTRRTRRHRKAKRSKKTRM
jgi:hypothetical protein